VSRRKPLTAQERRHKAEMFRRMRKAGIDPYGGPTFGERFAGDLLSTARDAPRGVIELPKAVGLDVRDMLKANLTGQRQQRRRGRPAFVNPLPAGIELKRTKRVARATRNSVLADLRHPLRHPGNTFLLGASAVSGGALAGVRGASALSAASRAARAKPPRGPRVAVKLRNIHPVMRPKVKELRAAEKVATRSSTERAIRAGASKGLRSPTRGERVLGATAAAQAGARRQRAAEELARRQKQAAALRATFLNRSQHNR
jgi:hypothetical protein